MNRPMTIQANATERAIAVTTHGRYLVAPSQVSPAPLVVGFHGYAESAEIQMARLQAISGSIAWTAIAIQGLHRFYERRSNTVVASWMTRQDRELAIADNVTYVGAVVDAEWAACQGTRGVVYAGFSQGVAMAFRAAVRSSRPVLGVIAAGGDVPPEIDRAALGGIGHVLLCHGVDDNWYTETKFEQDQARLREAGVTLTACGFAGGHEWSAAVLDAAARFLEDLAR
jgi:predicted esterase